MSGIDRERARQQEMLDKIRLGKVLFTKGGNPGKKPLWLIVGPAESLVRDARVTVTKADGTEVPVIVGAVHSTREVDGVRYSVADFTRIAQAAVTVPAPVQQQQSARKHPIRRDRTATRVAGMLGMPAPAATGSCHYCGLELNLRGECEECR
jgi:hypothetical protein